MSFAPLGSLGDFIKVGPDGVNDLIYFKSSISWRDSPRHRTKAHGDRGCHGVAEGVWLIVLTSHPRGTQGLWTSPVLFPLSSFLYFFYSIPTSALPFPARVTLGELSVPRSHAGRVEAVLTMVAKDT